MKIRDYSVAAVVAAIIFMASAALGQAPEMSFQGVIFSDKGSAPFSMSLTRDGSSLLGDYYYLRSGAANKLTLKGSVEPNGSFTMREFDGAGKVTGEFKGKWHEDANDPGVTIDGDWTKTGAKDSVGFSAEQQMIYFTSGAHFNNLEVKEAIPAKRAKLSAQYPQLVGVPGAAGFNLAAKAAVDREFVAFRKVMAGFSAADIKSEPAEMGNYLDVGYSVDYADNDLVSIHFTTDEFTGGAHGNQGFFTLVYDLKAGKKLTQAELFKSGARYLNVLSDYAQKDLAGRKDPDSGENMGLAQDIWVDGVKPDAVNFQDWSLTKKGVLILFPPYQVAAYAYGPQSVIVPYSKLRSIAADGSPILRFAK